MVSLRPKKNFAGDVKIYCARALFFASVYIQTWSMRVSLYFRKTLSLKFVCSFTQEKMNISRLFRAIYFKKILNIPAGSNNYNQVYVAVVRRLKKLVRSNYSNYRYYSFIQAYIFYSSIFLAIVCIQAWCMCVLCNNIWNKHKQGKYLHT